MGDRKLIALATSVYFAGTRLNNEMTCGLVKWCIDAERFAKLPFMAGRAVPVIWTNDPDLIREECPQQSLSIRPYEKDFVDLVHKWSQEAWDRWGERERIKIREQRSFFLKNPEFVEANLVKWKSVGETEFESILLIDTDVDFFHAAERMTMPAYLALAREAWTLYYRRFIESDAVLLGTPDNMSPINGGVMLFKPSTRLYDLGMRAIQTMRWNVTHGFGLAGRPRDLMSAEDAQKYESTYMVSSNSYNIVNGDADQGLFAYVFAMVDRSYRETTNGRYHIHHNWAASKPWAFKANCALYFEELDILRAVVKTDCRDRHHEPDKCHYVRVASQLPVVSPAARNGHKTRCWRHLEKKAEELINVSWMWRCRGQEFRVF